MSSSMFVEQIKLNSSNKEISRTMVSLFKKERTADLYRDNNNLYK